MELAHSPETPKLLRPTFYLCAGVAGAGCTTAVENLVKSGIARAGPGQIVSRPARAEEIHAGRKDNRNAYKQYYFVKADKMEKTKPILRTYQEKYGNTYGFTSTAVEKIKIMLTTSNVILDALGSKDDWQILLGNKPLVMLYFAPENLALTGDRLRLRMQAQNGKINETEFILRLKANARNIGDEIGKYDYWIDTTDLNEVVPAVTSVIALTSYGETSLLHPRVVSISENAARIDQLIGDYQTDSM
ncbi:MAG: hypothetical protein AAB481_02620 [Patescibacteria group bacterium]